MTFFAPLLGDQPHTLILGSMPSQISLRNHQYYANPNNAFWWIVGRIYGFSDGLCYRHRSTELTASGVAVWDVLSDAIRPGSMDSNIQRASEKTNDFVHFFQQSPSTKLIGFNGAAAKQIFMRHCAHVLQNHHYLKWVQLPSSSPAHATLSKTQKLQIWRAALAGRTQAGLNV